MRSALAIVAFSQGNKSEGVTALLEVALTALDEEGLSTIAVYVDMALALLKTDKADKQVRPTVRNRMRSRKSALH